MNPTNENKSRTSERGFASMDKDVQKSIASKGGKAVSRNREHMAEIGRKGGEASGERRKKKAANEKLRQEGKEVIN
jgi:uncharacterized protein